MFKTLDEANAAYNALKADKEAADASVAALTTKNSELISEKKTAVTRATTAEARVAELTAEAETLRTELTTKTSGSTAAMDSLKAQHTRDLADRDAKIADQNKRIEKLLVTDGLRAALTEAGVAPHFLKAAETMLAAGARVEPDGEGFKVSIGDKALPDAVKAWAASDDGKHFVAVRSTGGGAGGGGKGGEGAANPYAKETRNLTEQGRLERENPTLAKQLREAAKAAA